MKALLFKIMTFFRREWFLFVMLVAIAIIIFLFSACQLL
jgi:hypothetical protein